MKRHIGNKIKVLVVDDHPIILKGLTALINSEQGMVVVGKSLSGDEALKLLKTVEADVVILDVVMPHKGGIDIIKDLKKDNPGIRILMLSSFGEQNKIISSLKAGADGYLLKDTSPDKLMDSIRDIHMGHASFNPETARMVLGEIKNASVLKSNEVEQLTRREIEVLYHLCQGGQNAEIGQKLCISERTVRSHVRQILQKLNLKNRTQAAIYALKHGYCLDNEQK